MIRHIKGGWQVVSESGKNLGKYMSYSNAIRRLKQVEWFKTHKKDK